MWLHSIENRTLVLYIHLHNRRKHIVVNVALIAQSKPTDVKGKLSFVADEDAFLYEIRMRFNYREKHPDQPMVSKYVSWTFKAQSLSYFEKNPSVENGYFFYYSENIFFNALANEAFIAGHKLVRQQKSQAKQPTATEILNNANKPEQQVGQSSQEASTTQPSQEQLGQQTSQAPQQQGISEYEIRQMNLIVKDEHDIPVGTKFEDLPDDWRCPRCKRKKEKFNKI